MVSIADFDLFLFESIAWRQDFHAHPELTFDVYRTVGLVADSLTAMGVDEVVTGIGKTGAVGVIRGAPTASGRVIGLRADMDALAMQEQTNLPYATKTDGKCMPAVTTAIRQCCWVRRGICMTTESSTGPWS